MRPRRWRPCSGARSPGYRGQVTAQAATIPEVLRDYAYGTYAVGKWHLTNIAHYGAAGPQDNWPLGRGFARWYGFHGALTDQWNPELYQDNRPIHLHPRETYHLSTDLEQIQVDFTHSLHA